MPCHKYHLHRLAEIKLVYGGFLLFPPGCFSPIKIDSLTSKQNKLHHLYYLILLSVKPF